MDNHEKARQAMQLSREIREKEDELTRLFGGEAARQRVPQKCGVCNEAGHTARFCPKKENAGAHGTGTA
jgi:hypothetical protein